ncbi:Uncharacterised protein [Mycobacteroides abscessus subsp. abscessus]|nr:Uncharacterised protein [Mycobacteroides abscessus subsp. abscessus]
MAALFMFAPTMPAAVPSKVSSRSVTVACPTISTA